MNEIQRQKAKITSLVSMELQGAKSISNVDLRIYLDYQFGRNINVPHDALRSSLGSLTCVPSN